MEIGNCFFCTIQGEDSIDCFIVFNCLSKVINRFVALDEAPMVKKEVTRLTLIKKIKRTQEFEWVQRDGYSIKRPNSRCTKIGIMLTTSRERCIVRSPKGYHDMVSFPLVIDNETPSSFEFVKSTNSNYC